MRQRNAIFLSTGLVLGMAPVVALASDFSGMFTILVGLPSLALANLIMGLLFMGRPSKTIRTTLSFTVIPVLVVGLLLFSDAASLFRHSRDTVTGAVFFGLYALAGLLFVLHMQRGVPPPPPSPHGE